MSLLGFVNRFIVQWFCIRITKNQEEKIEDYKLLSFDLMLDGSVSSRGMGKTVKYQWYSIMYWVFPTTGWGSDYKYLNKEPKYLKITEKKII